MNDQLYKEAILDLNRNPLNKKVVADADVTEKAHNPHCGDDYSLSIKFDGDTIVDIGFSGDGCAISTAALSLLTDEVKGKSKQEVSSLTEQQMIDMLGIEISYTRKKCAILGLETLKTLCHST